MPQENFLGEAVDLRVGTPDIIREVQGCFDQFEIGEDLFLILYQAFEFCVGHGNDHFSLFMLWRPGRFVSGRHNLTQ